MSIKNPYSLLLLLSLTFNLTIGQTGKDSIPELTKEMTLSSGILDTYLSADGKLFFTVDRELLDKDLLMVTRIAQIPANYSAYSNAGSKTAESVVHFSKSGNRILLTQISYSNIANDNDPIKMSVEENNFSPILASFDIKNSEADQFLIDVTEHFMDDSPGFNIIPTRLKDDYKIGKRDKSRSQIDSARSFPENTEILHTLTFPATNAPRGNNTGSLTFQINHSIILLPEIPMKPRFADHRVGWFSISQIDYSSEALKSDEMELIRRWRLEPKDEAAYARGELVEPKKPIVYYLDPATPIKWRPYFIQGIEDWNSAFEKAGFKNAIQGKIAPTPEEDPNFSPEDTRFSTVRYVASTTRNAVGPSVSDPRTGEIIESDIIWYHNHLRSYRNRYLLETGAANPKARSLDTPEEEIGEMMRRVISHEIGHALGLPHNMKASSAYPVDSLRSGDFTQKMGIATTIMDYARFNYIAQPGDQNIRFVRQLGPYDDYAIEFGYRYFPTQTVDQEKEWLRLFVDNKSTDPMYMYGSTGNDPNAQTENVGDDPVLASSYGLKNLRIVAQNLPEWVLTDGDNYDDLNELYDEMIGVYSRYIYHVHSIVGGIYETLHNTNQKGLYTYSVVPVEEQKRALRFLNSELWSTPKWLLNSDLISNIKGTGNLDRIEDLQASALGRLLSSSNLNKMLSSEYTLVGNGLSPAELMQILFTDIFVNNKTPDVYGRNLQKSFVENVNSLINDKQLGSEIKGLALFYQKEIHKLSAKRVKSGDKTLQAHYDYCKSQSED